MTEVALSPFEQTGTTTSDTSDTDVTLREQLWMNPSLVWLRSKDNAVLDVTSTAIDEILDKPKLPLGAAIAIPAASIAASGITQFYDRTRVVIQKAPPEAVDAMVRMEFSKPSTLVATGIVAGSFAVWNFFAGEVLNRTMQQFPRTTERFIERFPRVVTAAEHAIPANVQEFNLRRNDSEVTKDQKKASKRLKRGFSRGWSAFSFGSTIHMGVATVNGIPANERTKINAEVTRDGAIFSMAPVVAGVAEAVRRSITEGDAEQAATILSWAQDGANWNKVGYAVMATTIGLNYRARKKAGKELEATKLEQ